MAVLRNIPCKQAILIYGNISNLDWKEDFDPDDWKQSELRKLYQSNFSMNEKNKFQLILFKNLLIIYNTSALKPVYKKR